MSQQINDPKFEDGAQLFNPMSLNQSIAIATLNKIPSSKQAIFQFANDLMAAVESGEVSPIDLKIQFKAIAEAEELLKDRLRELCVTQVERHGKTMSYRGFDIKVQEAGIKYDYSANGDGYLKNLMEQQQLLVDQIKEREAISKAVGSIPLSTVDPKSGEVYTVYPPVKKSTTTVVLSFAKESKS